MLAIRNTPLALLIAAMIALGGARAAGGAYFMSAFDAREALSRGLESPLALSEAADRLRVSTMIWPHDARAWDALGALSLDAAFNDETRAAAPAIAAFGEAIARAPGQPLFRMRHAAAFHAADRDDEAIGALRASLDAGAFHPQATRFRFSLGVALWPSLPEDLRIQTALQGAAALRRGKDGLRFVARNLGVGPAELRIALFSLLTLDERAALIAALRELK